jgi:hypothetical protein
MFVHNDGGDICILHMSKSKEQHQKLSNSMSDEDHTILLEESRPDGRNGRGDRCGNRLLPTMMMKVKRMR